jgi:hypothetical protein
MKIEQRPRVCDYDDTTARNLLRLMAEIESAHSRLEVASITDTISDATFMHTQARSMAQRQFVENLRS